jgi:hypothetical protein
MRDLDCQSVVATMSEYCLVDALAKVNG